jgi:small-conductance mechanosensitive channel
MAEFLNNTLGLSEHAFYGNSLADWVIAGLVAAGVWVALSVVRRLIASRYERYAAAGHPTPVRLIFYLLGHTRQFLVLAIALYVGQEDLTFAPHLQHLIDNAVLMLLLLQAGLWAGRALKFYLEIQEMERGPDRVFAGSLDIIKFVAHLLIWSLLILVALENLGVNITALLAGLGVGGVAVALALQNVLGDLFASLSIALDKPFVVGDTLTIDSFTGSVERIGIKSTRLRSDTGEQIILSNADILKSRVRNFGRAPEQRALATIRVDYRTPGDTLQGLPKVLERIVREQANARFERCHLKALGEWCLQYELSYFVQNPKINPLLDLQHAVNLRIIDEFRRLGVAFAYPAQRVIVESSS